MQSSRVITSYQCFIEDRNKPNVITANAFRTFLSLCRKIVGTKTELQEVLWLLFCLEALYMLSHLLEIKIEMSLAAFKIFSSYLSHAAAHQVEVFKAPTSMQANSSPF